MAEFRESDPLGLVRFTEVDPPSGQGPEVFKGWLTKPPIVTAGYGGWSRVARPRKKALTEWVGRDSMSLEIEFLVDNHAKTGSRSMEGIQTERTVRSLERFAGIDIHDPEPPLFILESNPPALIPHNHHHADHVRWFVESLTWDKES